MNDRVKVFALCLLPAALPAFGADWNPRLAAGYLDARQKEWFAWAPAKASGGPCVSCHTQVTYLLARPGLRRALGEDRPTQYETGLLDALRARVPIRDAKEVLPAFKREPAASQALGVESIHAALFLAANGWNADAQAAFDRMWSVQIREGQSAGAWEWFSLNLDPWEMPESRFYGASLAAMAIGYTPADYRKQPEIRERVTALVEYLRRELPSQPLHNRLTLLWASKGLPEVLPAAARKSIIEEAWSKQQTDGGWTLESLGPFTPHQAAPPSAGSNSYATALVAFVLRRAGVDGGDPKLKRALDWLRAHQDAASGSWAADSMNKRFEAESMQIRFMRDAATAFASMALLESAR
jgi:squalene-hopene/tetraprenyl-beta-curcumene cyclase